MVVSWNNHNEIIVQCGKRLHSRFLIKLCIKTANISICWLWSSSFWYVISCRVVQKSKLSYQSVISDISDWACDPSLSTELVGLKMHSADSFIPLLAQEITVMRLFQGFHTTLHCLLETCLKCPDSLLTAPLD